jgi:hypothetical protein
MKQAMKIMVAPLMGLLFAVFLPAIGILMAIVVLIQRLVPSLGITYDPIYNYFAKKQKSS